MGNCTEHGWCRGGALIQGPGWRRGSGTIINTTGDILHRAISTVPGCPGLCSDSTGWDHIRTKMSSRASGLRAPWPGAMRSVLALSGLAAAEKG